MEGREEVNEPDDVGITTGIVLEAFNQPLGESQGEQADDEEVWSRRWWGRARW